MAINSIGYIIGQIGEFITGGKYKAQKYEASDSEEGRSVTQRLVELIKGRPISALSGSLAKEARKNISQFPILTVNTLPIETLSKVSKKLENTIAHMLMLCVQNGNDLIDITSNSNAKSEYIRKFVGSSGSGVSDAFINLGSGMECANVSDEYLKDMFKASLDIENKNILESLESEILGLPGERLEVGTVTPVSPRHGEIIEPPVSSVDDDDYEDDDDEYDSEGNIIVGNERAYPEKKGKKSLEERKSRKEQRAEVQDLFDKGSVDLKSPEEIKRINKAFDEIEEEDVKFKKRKRESEKIARLNAEEKKLVENGYSTEEIIKMTKRERSSALLKIKNEEEKNERRSNITNNNGDNSNNPSGSRAAGKDDRPNTSRAAGKDEPSNNDDDDDDSNNSARKRSEMFKILNQKRKDAKIEKKYDEMPPTIVRTDVIVKNGNEIGSTAVVFGVKVVVHLFDPSELVTAIKDTFSETSLVVRLVRWRVGELRFIKDVLMNIKQVKGAVRANSGRNNGTGAKAVFANLRFKVQNAIASNATKLNNGSLLPTCILAITKDEIEEIRRSCSKDIYNNIRDAREICSKLALFGICVIDPSNDSMECFFDDGTTKYSLYSLKSKDDDEKDGVIRSIFGAMRR